MKILFLTQTYPRFGDDTSGPFIRELARALVRGGDEVTVLAPHAKDVRAHQERGLRFETFRYAPTPLETIGYSRSLDRDERMRPLAALAVPAYLLAARLAVRRLCAGGRFDLVQAHWVIPNLLAVGAPRDVPVAVGLHGSDVFLAERRELRRIMVRALRRVAVMTGCSPELVDRVSALGLPPERAHVIPYGVDATAFAPGPEGRQEWRDSLGIPDSATVVLSVGRMATKKGYQVLIPSLGPLFERHPGLHVVLAGGGDRLAELTAAAKELPRLHFPGIVYRRALPGLYRAADIFVLPAVHDGAGNVDGLPNVILEAMASGLPVVASGISGIPLAVEHDVTGLLVPEGDGAAAAAALEALVNDRERAAHLGTAGRAAALSRLGWDAVADRYREAYREGIEWFRRQEVESKRG